MAKEQKWINEGGIFFPISGNVVLHNTPGPGVWTATQSPNPNDNRIGLSKLGDKFIFDYKIYQLGGEEVSQRIKYLWENDSFVSTNKNLGVIFNGTKGTGKTVAAKLLCNELDIPVVVVNNSFNGGILDFISSLNFECVVLIDEAEKTFKRGEEDEILLKLIDGVYNNARKLYLLTTNTLSVNENLLGRPGRIRYIQEFRNLPPQAVSDYVDDNLIDKTKKEKILQAVDLLEISTIDILKSIVEEVNIFGELGDSNLLNVPMASHIFDVVKLSGCDKNSIDKLSKLISMTKSSDDSLYEWYNKRVPVETIMELLVNLNSEERNNFEEDLIEEPIREKDVVVPDKKRIGKALSQFATVPVKPEKEEGDEDSKKTVKTISIEDLIRYAIPECDWASMYKMTSSYNSLWKDCEVSLGTITVAPDQHGFMFIRGNWDGEESLYLLLRQRNNPSLYKGGLLL